MSDEGGYPSEEELQTIRLWPYSDVAGWFAFIGSIWHYGDWGWQVEGEVVTAHTGGWSGNEDIIEAMMENVLLWLAVWQRSERGGHFTFTNRELPR